MHEWLLSIEPWAEVWVTILWRATWQGTLALSLAWGIVRTCTFLSPRVVCWVWRAACLKVLATFLWVQPVSLALLPPQPRPALAVTTELAMPAASVQML